LYDSEEDTRHEEERSPKPRSLCNTRTAALQHFYSTATTTSNKVTSKTAGFPKTTSAQQNFYICRNRHLQREPHEHTQSDHSSGGLHLRRHSAGAIPDRRASRRGGTRSRPGSGAISGLWHSRDARQDTGQFAREAGGIGGLGNIAGDRSDKLTLLADTGRDRGGDAGDEAFSLCGCGGYDGRNQRGLNRA
jgi:hypothetical protein